VHNGLKQYEKQLLQTDYAFNKKYSSPKGFTLPEGCYGFLRLSEGYYIQQRYMKFVEMLMRGPPFILC
jgi:hypothetical protein